MGFYPHDLLLLEETSMTLTEIDTMDPQRKAEFILFILERKRKQKEELEKLTEKTTTEKATYHSEADFTG